MSKIKDIIAREIEDSRGNPTIEVELETERGSFVASVPSGASTGKNEALELRDADGKGVNNAIENINEIIAPKLKGKNPENQQEIDKIMIELDGTENKSKLGANAILAVSMAVCRAGAGAQKIPLYQHIREVSLAHRGELSSPLECAGIKGFFGHQPRRGTRPLKQLKLHLPQVLIYFLFHPAQSLFCLFLADFPDFYLLVLAQ